MEARLVVDLIRTLQHQARSEIVIDADLVLLASHRHVDGRAKRRQVQGRWLDALEIDVAIAVDRLEIFQVADAAVPRPIGDLRIEALARDVAKAEGLRLLLRS